MRTAAHRIPLLPTALAATLLTAFLILVAPLSASAHDALVGSSPEEDSTLETLPSELTLTFSAKVDDTEGATEVVVTDATGARVDDGAATVNGAIVTQPLTGSGPAGEYHVTWRIVSSDGHPTSEEFSFTVTTGTESTATPTPTPSEASSVEQSATPIAEPVDDDTDFGAALPWIIGGIVIAAAGGAALAVLVAKARRTSSGGESDGPAAR